MVSRSIALAFAATLVATVLVMGIKATYLRPEISPVVQFVPLEPAVSPEIATLLAEGKALRSTGRFEEALERYDTTFKRSAERSTGRAWALIGRGQVAKARGQVYKALAFYHRALEIFRGLGDRQGESTALHNLGACFTAVGELTLARDRYQEALDYRTNDAEMAITLSHLATLDDLAGQHELAIQGFRYAFALRLSNLAERESERLHGRASILDRLGTAAMFANRPAVARRAYRSALELYKQIGRSRAFTTGNLGRLEIDGCAERRPPCDPLVAVRHFDVALSGVDSEDHPEAWAILLTGKARALRHAGQLVQAEATARQGLALVESLRGQELQPLLRTAFLSRHHALYDELITILMRRHRLEPEAGYDLRALGVAELARARSLLERTVSEPGVVRDTNGLDQGQGDLFSPSALAELRREMNDLERRRLEKVDRLTCLDTVEPERMASHLEEVAELERRLNRLLLAIEDSQRSLRAPRPDSAPWFADPKALRKRIDDHTALLVYALGREASFLWWIDREANEVFELPARSWLEPRVRETHRAMAESDQARSKDRQRVIDATQRELSDALLGPVADRLVNQRLAILPDGVLHTLPFAALPRPVDGEPLVEHHEVTTLPSIALWTALERREIVRAADPAMAERHLLSVLADAVYSVNDRRLAGVKVTDDDMCSPPSALPETAKEARHLGALVATEHRREYLGFNASRQSFVGGDLSSSRIVHVAVHGELNESRPELSYLQFSRYDPVGRRRDGRVFSHEIDDLIFRADLVVLSACDTGRGKVVRGEGVVGMTQAVLAAGASRALVSLWPVDDGATAELMKDFYQALLERGAPPTQALRQAQRAMRRDQQYQAPFYWAGFVLVGDWRWPGESSATPP